MAFFGVTIEKIGKVWKHSNADSLDLASLEGISFQFVVGKDSMKPGDLVVYFPIDSLLSDAVKAVLPEVIVKKLSGKDHARIRTTKLRGEISQGLAFEADKFPWAKFQGEVKLEKGFDCTAILGVTRYEPPIVNMGNCELHRLPEFSPYFDIEGADRNQHIIDHLIALDVDIVASEKLEGTNQATVVEIPDYHTRICQRSGEVILGDEKAVSIYHEGAKRMGLPDKATKIAEEFNQAVTVRGELLGPAIQKNIYELKSLEVHAFEIDLNGKPMDWIDEKPLMDTLGIKGVPVLFVGKLKDFLNGRTIQEVSNGMSVLNPKVMREGVVIRPVRELPEFPGYGRILIKQRSPEYLAKYDN